jgi:16S rRNA (guanine527-N7)-methyltransferase
VTDERLERWLKAVLETPGMTGYQSWREAWWSLVEDAFRAVEIAQTYEGDIIDVGSGGGSPGIPLAAALPERSVTLLDSNRRKCEFLEVSAREFPNVRVVWGRAEEQEIDRFGIAVSKALARPPVAAEWCLPLVKPGGVAILWVGRTADADAVARVAAQLASRPPLVYPGLFVLPKLGPTPEGFPRRPGVARKRPLA